MRAVAPKLSSLLDLSETQLRTLAGSQSYARGLAYFQRGAVSNLNFDRGVLRAIVSGSRQYNVEVSIKASQIEYDCTCPYAEEENFCKHCVAAVLALRNQQQAKSSSKPLAFADVQKILSSQTKAELLELISQLAHSSPTVNEAIVRHVSQRANPAASIAQAKAAFLSAYETHGYVSYYQASGRANQVLAVIDTFAEILNNGHPDSARELCEFALKTMCEELPEMDDSDGQLTDISYSLQELHLEAAKQSRPNPTDLAKFLFEFQSENQLSDAHDHLRVYGTLLGNVGLAEYGKCIDKARDDMDADQHQRLEVAYLEATGDIDAVVALKSRRITTRYQCYEFVNYLTEIRRPKQALAAALSGMQKFPAQFQDNRLETLTVKLYLQMKQPQAAIDLAWKLFQSQPSVNTYEVLGGAEKFAALMPDWHQRALAILLQDPKRYGQDILRIHQNRGEIEAAWEHATRHGCQEYTWIQLAHARAKTHPAEAGYTLLRIVGEEVGRTSNGKYEEAVALLKNAGEYLRQAGNGNEFEQSVDALRARFKAKRNFVALLDKHRQRLYRA
jgi:uncharacterized Zn finger protein